MDHVACVVVVTYGRLEGKAGLEALRLLEIGGLALPLLLRAWLVLLPAVAAAYAAGLLPLYL